MDLADSPSRTRDLRSPDARLISKNDRDATGRTVPGPDVLVLSVDRLATPIGELVILEDESGRLRSVDWTDHEPRLDRLLRQRYGTAFRLQPRRVPGVLATSLSAYFAGDLAAIESLPVMTDGTAFQREVWSALRAIPCGTTISYGELARRIGRPAAVRAVGLANGSNPVGIVIPCHRVIGADGSLTGYGGGLNRKRWLLDHEAIAGSGMQTTLPLGA
ncbi:MAG: methylated-DNA--[protein]-cysteine S-methyltransferase [Microvirga sp.]